MQDSRGNTALIYAANYGHIDILQAVISDGADINAKGEGGNTALMEAAYAGHLDIVDFLVKKGADQTLTNDSGGNVLFYAKNPQTTVSEETKTQILALLTPTSVAQ